MTLPTFPPLPIYHPQRKKNSALLMLNEHGAALPEATEVLLAVFQRSLRPCQLLLQRHTALMPR